MEFKKTESFIKENFLLQTKAAERLYFEHAADMPIIDYHNHLSPQVIAANQPFEGINQIWLDGDHYKWRAMRSLGVPEKFITGKETTNKEKFDQWAYTVPFSVGNPLFHWTHLELDRYFGIKTLLQPSTSTSIFEETNLQLENITPNTLLKKMKVEMLCTTSSGNHPHQILHIPHFFDLDFDKKAVGQKTSLGWLHCPYLFLAMQKHFWKFLQKGFYWNLQTQKHFLQSNNNFPLGPN